LRTVLAAEDKVGEAVRGRRLCFARNYLELEATDIPLSFDEEERRVAVAIASFSRKSTQASGTKKHKHKHEQLRGQRRSPSQTNVIRQEVGKA
jgi:hypothetical protein